ncbi:MAG: PIG-L deacetylase family protein [Marinobacter sp.]
METIARIARNDVLYPPATLNPVNTAAGQAGIPLTDLGPILIASPHPDDETLGCGGLISRCAALGVPITLLSITNGEASHPGDVTWQRKLATIRQQELRLALGALGITEPDIVPLCLPDGGLEQLDEAACHRAQAHIQVLFLARNIRTVFVPAADDCHGDHRWTARLMAGVVGTRPVERLFSYQIWPPQHRSRQMLAAEQGYSHDISDLLAVKRQAIQQYRSQLGVVDVAHAGGFRMPDDLLEAKLSSVECFARVTNIENWLPGKTQS